MPLAHESIEGELIAPRHLAGGGDPAWITVPLHRASNWSYGHDPLMPRVLLSSPDQKALLRLEPDPGGPWWTLHHAAEPDRPAWYASFGARTPVELIAAVTDALTDPAPAAQKPTDPYEPLRQIAWTPSAGAPGFVSPDGATYVQRSGTVQDPGSWWVTATLGRDRAQLPVWQARFDERTPVHLVTAFTAALADPRPVPRTDSPRCLPTRDPGLITRRPTDIPVASIASALEERVQSLAARRSAPAANPSPPLLPPPMNSRGR
ncbi:DUF317 domain-containing protein [Streptomyces sp. NPDC091416]|uniref:DUF317 domain-containing protein n=1 Tax=Streptomyces sp. NPDC091416 TaxID=3366003 RepID=UPI0038235224